MKSRLTRLGLLGVAVWSILCCQTKFAKAQATDPNIIITEKQPDNGVRMFVGQGSDPFYPGGSEALFRYLDSTIVYPAKALKNKIGGRVIMQFVIEKDGHLADIKAVRSPSEELGNECVRVFKNVVYKPALYNGQPHRIMYTMPVIFDPNNPKVHHTIQRAFKSTLKEGEPDNSLQLIMRNW